MLSGKVFHTLIVVGFNLTWLVAEKIGGDAIASTAIQSCSHLSSARITAQSHLF
jgi:hypothetical protein